LGIEAIADFHAGPAAPDSETAPKLPKPCLSKS
jgi:hypothetical protein